jgi:hypothetical protein
METQYEMEVYEYLIDYYDIDLDALQYFKNEI